MAYIGLDVGGTNLKGARVSAEGTVQASLHEPIVRDFLALGADVVGLGLSLVGRARRVRPLSIALQAFGPQWPWAPYGSGMSGREGWYGRRARRLDRRS